MYTNQLKVDGRNPKEPAIIIQTTTNQHANISVDSEGNLTFSDKNFPNGVSFIPASAVTLTDYYTKTSANGNFLSASTSYYTQSQSDTRYYTKTQCNNNFLSAATFDDYYLKTESDGNFLSASTSFYTQAQVNGNFLSASTTLTSSLDALTDCNVDFTKNNVIIGNDYTTEYTLSSTGSNYVVLLPSYGDIKERYFPGNSVTIDGDKGNPTQTLIIDRSSYDTNGTKIQFTTSITPGAYLTAKQDTNKWINKALNLYDIAKVSVKNGLEITNDVLYYDGSNWINYNLSAYTYTKAQSNANFLSASTSFYTQAQSDNRFVNPDVAEEWVILRDIDPESTGNTYKVQISGGTLIANIVV